MDHYKFSTLEYKRPDGEARRAQLIKWKEAVEHAENYDALRKLMASGIICGDENGMINPLEKATRAETAKIVFLLLKYVNAEA